MRAILAIVALLIGAIGIVFVGNNIQLPAEKAAHGVYHGIAIAPKGAYYVIDGTEKSIMVGNYSLIRGTFILLDGYLINGTKLEPVVVSGLVEGLVVYQGDGVTLSGTVERFGNFTVVRGRVMLFNARVYYRK